MTNFEHIPNPEAPKPETPESEIRPSHEMSGDEPALEQEHHEPVMDRERELTILGGEFAFEKIAARGKGEEGVREYLVKMLEVLDQHRTVEAQRRFQAPSPDASLSDAERTRGYARQYEAELAFKEQQRETLAGIDRETEAVQAALRGENEAYFQKTQEDILAAPTVDAYLAEKNVVRHPGVRKEGIDHLRGFAIAATHKGNPEAAIKAARAAGQAREWQEDLEAALERKRDAGQPDENAEALLKQFLAEAERGAERRSA